VVDRLAQAEARMRAAGCAPNDPLLAWGFDPIYFGGERMTVEHLDRASATRPIVIGHANGHLMNVNTAMLKLAEITRDNEVEGVVKFAGGAAAGEPTGELQEPAAMFLVNRKIGNAGLLVLSNPVTPGDSANALGYGFSIARALTNAFELVGEVNGRLSSFEEIVPGSPNSRAVLRFAGRYTYAMLRLDFGILAGITNSDPNFGISAGATYVITR